jgi:creatinine amidohydrolase
MTREEARAAAEEKRVVLIPTGAIEQHGPFLPIDTDNLIVSSVCDEAARRRPGLLLSAPEVGYGYNEHNMDFPGTISIRPHTLIDFYFDVGESFARQGFERIIYVNGHGSNAQIANIAARMVVTHSPALAISVDAWNLAAEVMAAIRESKHPGGTGHAGEYETSLYLYLQPELVVKEKIQDRYPPVTMNGWFAVDLFGQTRRVGFTNILRRDTELVTESAASLATEEKGENLFGGLVTSLISLAEGFQRLEVGPRRELRAEGAYHPSEFTAPR